MEKLDWVLAYANESTDFEWLQMGLFYEHQFDMVINAARHYAETNMKDSAIGIFVRREGGIHWVDRKPRRIYNRHVLYRDENIRANLGGLINSLGSDWF